MFKISKEFHFSASHQLQGLPNDHPCTRLHGHNYMVKVVCEAEELDETGFVVDYHNLDVVKNWIDSNLDHKHLNDVLPFNPTAENMAKYLFYLFNKTIPQLSAVYISETPKTLAKYVPSK